MRFRPRAVPARNALAWLREAVALTVRAPLAFVGLGLGHAALFLAPDPIGDLAFCLVPLVLGLGAGIARAADECRDAFDLRVSRAACARLALVGLGIGMAALYVASLLERLGPAPAALDLSGPLAAPNAVNEALGIAAHAAWFWALALGPTLWFCVPLVVLPGLGLRGAAVQAMEAFLLNRFLVLVWGASVALGGLATLVPVAVVPFTAVLSATLYAGYRDVWLGRSENAPRAVLRAASANA